MSAILILLIALTMVGIRERQVPYEDYINPKATLPIKGFFLAYNPKTFACYIPLALTFTGLIVLISMRFEICSPLCVFAGQHVFSIYIMQRLPMMVLDHFGILDQHPYMSFFLALCCTVVIALCFEKLTGLIRRKTGIGAIGASA